MSEYEFVDKDIAKEFCVDDHFIGTASLVQLNRNLGEIIKLLKKGNIGGIEGEAVDANILHGVAVSQMNVAIRDKEKAQASVVELRVALEWALKRTYLQEGEKHFVCCEGFIAYGHRTDCKLKKVLSSTDAGKIK